LKVTVHALFPFTERRRRPSSSEWRTLRRATIYANQDRKVATALLKAVVDRAKAVPQASRDPLPWFDAGYLIESYRQMTFAGPRENMLAEADALLAEFRTDSRGAEGYGLVRKGIQLAGANAEMEFAASLMQEGASAASHRQRAVAGAAAGSLLAKNLPKLSK
jgi:hypothetical protein